MRSRIHSVMLILLVGGMALALTQISMRDLGAQTTEPGAAVRLGTLLVTWGDPPLGDPPPATRPPALHPTLSVSSTPSPPMTARPTA